MQTFIVDDDYPIPRMKIPDLRINYTPIDPDHFDRPVVSYASRPARTTMNFRCIPIKRGNL